MTKFKVLQKYFDTGKVEVSMSPCNSEDKAGSEERKGFDLYIDVFETKQEAEEFRQECETC